MRALPAAVRLSGLCLAVLLAACETSERKLKDVSYGETIEGEYDFVLERAKFVVLKHFPKGFDPDKTIEEKGDFWTVWHVKTSMMYRGTTRERGHLVVEDLGDNKVRVGVSVVRQINDNIDNPHLVDEARWVRSHRDPEMEARMEAQIARRYLESEPSEQWKVRQSGEKSPTIRDDLIDRYDDVDLESGTRLGYEEEGQPDSLGRERFYGDDPDHAWKDKYGFEKRQKELEEERRKEEERRRQEEQKKKKSGQ
jgi:hypothetical protein